MTADLNSMVNLRKFAGRPQLVQAVRDATVAVLEEDIQKNGQACWMVSGGSTPKPLFQVMSSVTMAWSKVKVALVDERWVSPDHSRSNEGFVRETLLKNKAAQAAFIGMATTTGTIADAAKVAEERYRDLTQPFSNVLLGLGPDGHTASLFPNADGLEAAMSVENDTTCAPITAHKSEVTGDEVERITLTMSAIRSAKSCYLMITGTEKMAVLNRALSEDTDLPIARVIANLETPLDVFWAP